jgi:hypothetical protein
MNDDYQNVNPSKVGFQVLQEITVSNKETWSTAMMRGDKMKKTQWEGSQFSLVLDTILMGTDIREASR